MKEIKFRGKAKGMPDVPGVVYGNLIICDNGQVFIDTIHGKDGQWTEVDPETVGQYSCEKDDSGSEIYEDDFLDIECEHCLCTHKVMVRRDGCTLVVDVCEEDFDSTAITWAMQKWDEEGAKVKVIGNNHELGILQGGDPDE